MSIDSNSIPLFSGANTMRDGVNLSDTLRSHQLVSVEEIMHLKDLEAYVKRPEGLPVVKVGVEASVLSGCKDKLSCILKKVPFLKTSPIVPLQNLTTLIKRTKRIRR